MANMLARLGHVFLILGILLGMFIAVIGLGFIALNIWTDGRSILEFLWDDEWRPAMRWTLSQVIIFCTTGLIANVVLLFCGTISYVLGGLSDWLEKDSASIVLVILEAAFSWFLMLIVLVAAFFARTLI